ncbi:MAG: hypothetical protein M5U28_27985 [Sandaracinaceae bacterium]|nr:hypothetical protein [Sandaracinaceae bacterium]
MVAAIERVRASVPGVEVIQRAQVAKTWDDSSSRDVDVLVHIPVQGRVLRIGIEVKYHGRRVTEDEMGQIVDLKNDVQLDRFCVVSTSGFSPKAVAKGRMHGVQMDTLRELEESTTFSSPKGSTVFERRFDIVGAVPVFAPEVLREHGTRIARMLYQVTLAEVELHEAGGVTALHVVLERLAHRSVAEGRIRGDDGEAIEVRAVVDPDQTSVMVRGERLPLPAAFVARLRCARTPLPEARFELLGMEISTVEVQSPEGPRQITIIAVPAPHDPTLKQIHLTTSPARPPTRSLPSE